MEASRSEYVTPRPTAAVESSTLSEAEADELRTILLDPRHIVPELKAFVYAWNGSIAFQRENGSKSLAHDAMDVNRFIAFFFRIEEASNHSLH